MEQNKQRKQSKENKEIQEIVKKQIRQPIVTVVGHVDHGKTSLLDSLRDSCVAQGEAGGITQKISFTSYPMSQLKAACPLIDKQGIKLDIPGFLLIDTPGHAAFTNLRKRGGSLADLAVLVVDINDGIKPQTAEVIQILKLNKTPFIIALNKIDNISGWNKKQGNIKELIETLPINVRQQFDEKLLTFIGSLHSHGFEADLFYNINDFTKKISIIPCSAKTKQGIQELIMMLCGLSQKYLEKKLELSNQAKGVVLEIKKEKSMSYAECILYDGILNKKDKIVIANFLKPEQPVVSSIRILEEVMPLCDKFKPVEKATASTGLRLQLIEKADILPGMPFIRYDGTEENKKQILEEFKKIISENIKTDKQGIIAKADSLGSLEALITLLKEANISILKAGIGSINKSDIISAKANLNINELDAIVVGFNVSIDEDAAELIKSEQRIKIIIEQVIYKLIENLVEYRKEKTSEIEKSRLMELATICKLEILSQYVFRNSNPAVFGVKVLGGKLTQNLPLITNLNERMSRIKNIQSNNKPVNEAFESMEVAVSLPGINFERRIKNTNIKFLYSDISESQFKKFKKNRDLLSSNEKTILQEIADIKRKEKPEWGA